MRSTSALPRGLQGRLQAFSLTAVEPGKFDLENSFIDQKKGTSLHVVARIKKPKAPPSAKKAAAPAEHPPPGANSSTTSSSWSRPPTASSSRPHSSSPSRRAMATETTTTRPSKLDLTTKEVEVYVYTEPNGVHEVAMIFEYPKTEKNT